MPRGRLRKRLFHFSSQKDHSISAERYVMPLNEERQVNKEQENEDGISNAMIILTLSSP